MIGFGPMPRCPTAGIADKDTILEIQVSAVHDAILLKDLFPYRSTGFPKSIPSSSRKKSKG